MFFKFNIKLLQIYDVVYVLIIITKILVSVISQLVILLNFKRVNIFTLIFNIFLNNLINYT